MLRHTLSAALVFATLGTGATTAHAADGPEALLDALGMDRMLQIMRDEGVSYGAELGGEMFPGRDGPSWIAAVEGIYDLDQMTATMSEGFIEAIGDTDLEPLLEFFTSDLGQQIVEQELTVREAFLEESFEEDAKMRVGALLLDGGDRVDWIGEFMDTGDLVEENVVGALNSNYAFYLGMMDGGGGFFPMTEQEALMDVWSQEAEIRADTTDWLYAYLYLAYEPLSDDEADAYLDLMKTEEGEELTQALFAGFDILFVNISRELGRAVAEAMITQEL